MSQCHCSMWPNQQTATSMTTDGRNS